MGLCLPLAVLIGYFLAEPMDSGSLAVIVMIMAVLFVPIMMKWYHVLLVVSWNASINPQFLPGRPFLWMIMAMGGLLFAILNRSVNPQRKFVWVPTINRPLFFLVAVVLGTAFITGGIGVRSLGSDRYGGKGYFFILAAVLGYFAFTSQRIPAHRANFFVALFFLSSLTALLGNVIYKAGPAFYFLYNLVPPENALDQASGENAMTVTIVRLGGLNMASTGLYAYLMARFGVRGVLDVTKPVRFGLFLLALIGCFYCGYRSVLILFVITFICGFSLEGLWRTRVLPMLIGAGLLAMALIAPQAHRLPWVVQRTLSFLPIKIDQVVRDNADASTEWRLEMWRNVMPQVPKYFFKGKGFSLDPNDLFMANKSAVIALEGAAAGAAVAGDYHNGPLSVIIPFGIWGVIAFGWFIYACGRVLRHHQRFGDPRLRSVNTFLFAFFIAKVTFFIVIYGSFWSDLCSFTGLIGLSISLNGAPRTVVEPVTDEEILNPFSQTV